MFKLVKDNKNIKNVNITSSEVMYKIVDTAKITILSSMLGLSLISIYESKLAGLTQKPQSIISDTLEDNKITLTYNEMIYNYCKSLVEKYAYVFNLKDDAVSNVIKQNIDLISEEELKSTNNIMGNDKNYDSYDIQVILIAKDLLKNPEKYGYKSEDIMLKEDERKESNLTIRQLVYKYADAFNLDRDIMLAIPCAESGWFKAKIATKKNNPYSYRGVPSFNTFDTIERGILEGELNLKLNYFDKGLNTIESFASIYCPDGTSHWLSLVNGAKNDLENGKKLYDEESKSLVMRGNNNAN